MKVKERGNSSHYVKIIAVRSGQSKSFSVNEPKRSLESIKSVLFDALKKEGK